MEISEFRIPQKKFCYWCITKGLESKMLGFRFIQCDCIHSDISTRHYYISWRLVVTNVAVVLLSLYVAVELINKLYKEGNVLAFDNRRTLAYIIGLTGGIAAVAVNPWDFRMHVTILELYNEVVNNYNFNAEDKLERKLRRIYNLMLTLFVGKLGGIVGYFLCDILARGADDYVDKMCLLLSFFYTLAIVQPAVGAASFYTYILLYAGEQIQKVFRWRIHDGNLETDRFVSQLGLFVMLQKRCQFSMRLYMKSLSRYMPICLTTIFFFCIIQFSLAVEMVMNADLKDEQIRGACAMLVGGLAAMSNMLFLMVYIDSSRNSVNNVISFINRFPTANLSPREISMVETLLSNFRARPFIVNIADMFTVGSEMIASFAGIIVTYVLVIVQLQMLEWNKT